MLSRVDYDQRQYAVYATARAVPAEQMTVWRGAFARWAPVQRPLTALDLGSGTGRYAPALAEEFGGPVVGVEPSERMRAVAETDARHDRVTYMSGSATQIPLPDGHCDLVLMFLVLHHVADKRAAAAEIARVLRPGGRLLIRSAFADRLPELPWHQYFPGARQVESKQFPRLDEVVETFERAGLRYVGLETVRERFAPSLAASAARLRLRAISTFEYLSEEETQRGFAALDAAVALEQEPQPVEGDSDLLILEA
jgi:SAM-dependent methyltransferase